MTTIDSPAPVLAASASASVEELELARAIAEDFTVRVNGIMAANRTAGDALVEARDRYGPRHWRTIEAARGYEDTEDALVEVHRAFRQKLVEAFAPDVDRVTATGLIARSAALAEADNSTVDRAEQYHLQARTFADLAATRGTITPGSTPHNRKTDPGPTPPAPPDRATLGQ